MRRRFYIALAVVMLVSLAVLYSASHSMNALSAYWERQILWYAMGLGLMFLLSRINYRFISSYWWLIYLATLVMLSGVLFFGVRIRGSRSWIALGSFRFQPSEFAKIFMIIVLSKVVSSFRRDKVGSLSFYLVVGALTLLPVLLVVLEPDFGTATVFFAIAFGIIFAAGIPSFHTFVAVSAILLGVLIPSFLLWGEMSGGGGFVRIMKFLSEHVVYFASGFLVLSSLIFVVQRLYGFLNRYIFERVLGILVSTGLGFVISFVLQKVLKDYQKARIMAFFDPSIDPLGVGYNILQSTAAIGSGGILGRGFLKGPLTALGFLPEPATDFAFSVLAENFGLLGVFVFLVAYMQILLSMLNVANNSSDTLGRCIAVGVFSMFLYHFFINSTMCLGMAPSIGIPLLLLGYGGSSVLASFMGLGLVLSVWRYSRMRPEQIYEI